MRLEKKTYQQLLIAMAGGDKRAFDHLYERFSSLLFSYFMRMLWRDREKSEDFVQDFFTKLIHKPELFDTTRCDKFTLAVDTCKFIILSRILNWLI